MAIYEGALSKRIGSTDHVIYPKTRSSLVKHNSTSTVEIDLNAATSNITKLKNVVAVTSAADMVDTTKIYVYASHFYEYNTATSQWVQLGAAGAEVTSTLSSANAGKAADAAAVDARFAPIETELSMFSVSTTGNVFSVSAGSNSTEVFSVNSSGDGVFQGNVYGTNISDLTTRMANVESIVSHFSTSESGYVFAMLDNNSTVSFGVTSSGDVSVAGNISSTNITTLTTKTQWVAVPTSTYVFRVTNTSGTVIFGITNDGQVKSTGAMTASTTL